jgi:hypothetical protein
MNYTGDSWPTANEMFVNNYLEIFLKFVKSVDIRNLQ